MDIPIAPLVWPIGEDSDTLAKDTSTVRQMPASDRDKGDGGATRLLEEARAARREREKSYRGQALKLFPPICGRCGREFSGQRLRELTVHHKDHNHDNNPGDGSNWELLCIYCHDEELQRNKAALRGVDGSESVDTTPRLTHRPFANLADLLKAKGKS